MHLFAWTGGASAQETVPVEVGDFYFCDSSLSADECTTTISSGDTVVWDYSTGTAGHTVTECGDSCDTPTASPLFDSGRMLAGDTFAVTFDNTGTYLYYCEFHPVAMRATVVVQPQSTPTPTIVPTQSPSPASTASPAPTPTLTDEPSPTITTTPEPRTTASPVEPEPDGDNGDGDGVPVYWFLLAGALAILTAAAAAVFAIRRRSA